MTSVTVKTVPSPKMVAALIAIVTPATSQASIDAGLGLAAYALSKFPSLGDAGLAGYTFILQSLANPGGGNDPTKYAGIAGTVALLDTQDTNDMVKLWDPIVAYANATWPGQFFSETAPTVYTSYWDWFQANKDNSATGEDAYVGSRLLDGPALTANTTATREAFRQFSSVSGVGTAYLVGGKGVMNAKPRGGSNAVLPAWRKAYVHASKLWRVSRSHPWRPREETNRGPPFPPFQRTGSISSRWTPPARPRPSRIPFIPLMG